MTKAFSSTCLQKIQDISNKQTKTKQANKQTNKQEIQPKARNFKTSKNLDKKIGLKTKKTHKKQKCGPKTQKKHRKNQKFGPKYYSSTTPYYKVLFHTTAPVLQSTTPVLLQYYRTTKYYSSTTPYYKVLLQYYSVLQSITPVLPKDYASTTPYFKVLLQYYSVLQSTTSVLLLLQSTSPVLLCNRKYYSSTTLYYKVLLCIEESYMKCH